MHGSGGGQAPSSRHLLRPVLLPSHLGPAAVGRSDAHYPPRADIAGTPTRQSLSGHGAVRARGGREGPGGGAEFAGAVLCGFQAGATGSTVRFRRVAAQCGGAAAARRARVAGQPRPLAAQRRARPSTDHHAHQCAFVERIYCGVARTTPPLRRTPCRRHLVRRGDGRRAGDASVAAEREEQRLFRGGLGPVHRLRVEPRGRCGGVGATGAGSESTAVGDIPRGGGGYGAAVRYQCGAVRAGMDDHRRRRGRPATSRVGVECGGGGAGILALPASVASGARAVAVVAVEHTGGRVEAGAAAVAGSRTAHRRGLAGGHRVSTRMAERSLLRHAPLPAATELPARVACLGERCGRRGTPRDAVDGAVCTTGLFSGELPATVGQSTDRRVRGVAVYAGALAAAAVPVVHAADTATVCGSAGGDGTGFGDQPQPPSGAAASACRGRRQQSQQPGAVVAWRYLRTAHVLCGGSASAR
eukprot:ctg_1990.g418